LIDQKKPYLGKKAKLPGLRRGESQGRGKLSSCFTCGGGTKKSWVWERTLTNGYWSIGSRGNKREVMGNAPIVYLWKGRYKNFKGTDSRNIAAVESKNPECV